MALPRFGTRVNFMKKTVEHPTTVLDSDGFLKPTKYFETPKTNVSTPAYKPKTNYKKIHKTKVEK